MMLRLRRMVVRCSAAAAVQAVAALPAMAAMLFAAATALQPAALAQTVSPVVVEYRGGAAAGSFDLTNDGLTPLVVTLEAKSFAIDRDGRGEFRRLDAGTHVSFSETSLRLPPHSRRTIYYKASAEAYPAWFSVYAMFHGLPRQNGMNVQLELPHTVYLLGDGRRAKARSGDLVFEGVAAHEGVVSGSVRNVSAKVLRVDSFQAQAGRAKVQQGGFPLLPGGVHDFSFALAEAREPARLVARFGQGSVALETVVDAEASR
jgi:hypothetical protein